MGKGFKTRRGGAGGGYALTTPLKHLEVVGRDDGKVMLAIEDPDDLVIDNTTIAAWGGNVVIAKKPAFPLNEKDGVVVADYSERDKYKSVPLEISGLDNDEEYHFSVLPYSDKGVFTVDAANRVKAIPSPLPLPGPLANFSWEDIARVSEAGLADTYWSVGDEIDIELSTTETITLQIYDFDHDTLTSDGVSKAGITFGMKHLMTTTRQMNGSHTNAGGWGSCAMRTWITGTLIGQLPVELQDVLKPVDKLTSAGSQSATINTTSDKVFLFSEVELFGGATHSKAGEGSQYPVYSDNASKIKKLSNGSGAAYGWYERSPRGSDSAAFCTVSFDGIAGGTGASDSYGVCWGFCV